MTRSLTPQSAGPTPTVPDYRALFEAIPGLYLVLDPQFVVIAVSDAYANATKTRREEIVGRDMFDIFPDNPDDPLAEGVRNLRASLHRVRHTGCVDSMPVQKYDIRKPESEGGGFEERYWSPLNTPVHDASGRLAYIIHRAEDITEFMRLKQQGATDSEQTETLRQKAMQMEAEVFNRAREVAEASAELKTANEELARLYEKTRELDELKSRFFANISHELRTPLTLLLGPLGHLLAVPERPADERQLLEVMQRNARLLHRRVDDLLDLAKLEAGGMSLMYVAVDLARLTRLAASHFESVAAERGIDYRLPACPPLPAEVDAEKYQRLLLNLLANAFKFVPDGGRIAVSLSVNASANRARLEISDNGPGIPPTMREAVFERFRQVEDGSTRRVGGTGLGLAIVKEFVGLHGGSVTVDETPGGGAHFTVDLPLQAPPGTSVGTAAPEDLPAATGLLDELPRPPVATTTNVVTAAAAATATTTAPATPLPLLLVVEDNPDMQAFIANALAPRYRVVCANDGEAGLQQAQALHPDLILSDVMMPRLSGDQLVEALRRQPEFDDTPIVMLTAKADDTLRLNLLRHGVQDYIHKPFSIEELHARVGGLLSERQRVGGRLRSAEERFRATFEQAAVGIAHIAPDGHWLRLNQKLCDILGHRHEQLLQLDLPGILDAADRDTVLDLQQQALSGALTSYHREIRLLRQDGQPLWITLTMALVRDERQAPDYFIAVIEDAQARKEAEQEIVNLNANLERRVQERTAELQAANRELDSFAYAVSHDLRAPLRAMSGFAQALEEDFGPAMVEGARDYLNEIVTGSRRMGELIDGLLALSRSTRGHLHRERLDLSALATHLRDDLVRSAPERQVSWDIAPGIVARGDRAMLTAVLQNLFDNAWKYTARTPQARIAFRLEDDGGGVRHYCISDNGAGFDMRHAEKLFQPFQRLHRQDEFPGIGIGLATVQRIVHRHGGDIDASASPGAGATFRFTLPDDGQDDPSEEPAA